MMVLAGTGSTLRRPFQQQTEKEAFMSKITSIITRSIDLDQGVARPVALKQHLIYANAQAHTFRLVCTRGGKPVSLDGMQCMGYVRRKDGVTIPVEGVTNGNVASVTLTAACYAVPGTVTISIELISGECRATHGLWIAQVECPVTDQVGGDAAISISDTMGQLHAALEDAVDAVVYPASHIIRTAEGAGAVYVSDSADREPVELMIYGRTEQQSTPTPTAPATFISTARWGSMTISSRPSLTDTEGQTSANVQVVDGLSGMPVNGGGNYINGSQRWLGDELDCKRGVIVRRLAKKTLTGTEDISRLDSWGEGTYRIYCGDAVDIGTVETLYGVMCTHAPATWSTTVAKGSIGAGRAGRFVLLNLGAEYNTVDLFKAYLAEQNEAGTPVEVLYELGTPVEEPLTASGLTIMLMTRMRKGGTAIVNDATAYMKLEYIADTKTYVDKAALAYQHACKNLILIGLGQQYETIQDAVDSITDDSKTNPYTLLLMPSATPYSRFSFQRKLDEERNPRHAPRWISIVGIDKTNTVVQSDTGEYESPPAEIVANGIIRNITFRMTNEHPDATPLKGGYAVHFDCSTPDSEGFNLLVEDCDFESATGPAVGIGVHENERLVFRHCRFTSTARADYQPNDTYKNLADYGCAFAHSSLRSDAQNMRISFEHCVGICAEGTKSLWLGKAGEYTVEKCYFEYTLIGNTFWNTALGKPAYYISSELYANPMNFGNNMDAK